MEISQFTDFSLRVLIYLSVKKPEETTSVRDIAETYDISRNHLVKVVHFLGQEGFLNTTRGRNGGIDLAFDPKGVSVGDVVRKTESLALVECLGKGPGACRIDGHCELKRALIEAKKAFLIVLDGYSIADLSKNRSRLQKLLSPAG